MHEPPLLVIIAKAPVCGSVKTRLAKETGAVAAVALTRTLTAALLRETGKDPRFQAVLAISPDAAVRARFSCWGAASFRKKAARVPAHPSPLPLGEGVPACWLQRRTLSHPHPLADADTSEWQARQGELARERDRVRGDAHFLKRIPQGIGGLGPRMQRIFDACGRGPLIIIGTDIPFIRREMIADAFARLRRADAVFGPAEDGGYWLVGLRRRPRRLAPFDNVRWSSPHALADTLGNLRFQRVAFAAALFDIDTEADYRRYLRQRYR